jgi:thiamine biosynthesis protein ThiS
MTSMTLHINGESRSFDGEITVAELLEALDIRPDGMAAVHNGTIVRRPQFEATALADGDELEIVRMVGGG